MRRLLVLLGMIFLLPVVMVAAQESTTTPLSPQQLNDLATQVSQNADRADRAMQDAQRYAQEASDEVSKHMDTANNLLGLFQNVTAIAGVIIPLLALLAAVSTLGRLNSAQNELKEARERFEKEMNEKQAELTIVRQELEKSAEVQRETAAKANVALSLLSLGERQYKSQDFTGAIDTYQRALSFDPQSLITHYRLGYVYTQSGNLEKAQYHLAQALEIDPSFPLALAALGYVHRRIGEKMPVGIDRDMMLNKAERYLLDGLTISPKLVDDDGESWWGSLGGLYRRRGQLDEAINAYEQAASVTPQSSYAFSNLALLYVQKQNVDAMMKTYRRVEQLAAGEVQADVDNYWAYADLLTARLALGKIEQARETLTSVLEVAPKEGPYVFESLLDTLRRLRQALGMDKSQHVQEAIDQIEAHVATRKGTQTPNK
jgi:tetratricopeptide (TPR) repeat protein